MRSAVPEMVEAARAREVAGEHRLGRNREVPGAMSLPPGRIPKRSSFRYGPRDKIRTTGLKTLQVGRADVDLSLVEQLVDRSQTRALAEVFRLLGRDGFQEFVPLPDLVDRILEKVQAQGLEWLSPFQGQHPGDLALPRKQEICAALNRWRKLVLEDSG